MEGKEEDVGGNGVGIMRKEMRRENNKESSGKTNRSSSAPASSPALVWCAGYQEVTPEK